jgi:hypothetical protein
MESDVNDEHPSKQQSPRDVTELGIESAVNEERP